MSKTLPMPKCKSSLTNIWLVGSGIAFVVVLVQTMLNHYGGHWEDVWGWFLPSVVPTLSLMISVAVLDAQGKTVQVPTVSAFIYHLARNLSVAYFVVLLATIFVQPVVPIEPLDLMKRSSVWLGPFQGLVAAALGAFFVRK